MSRASLKSGTLLIAEPFLGDPNFERSVILLCNHNDEGSFGFILNQISKINLQEIQEDELYVDMPLYIGGPVEQNTLHFIHCIPEQIEGSIPIVSDLSWSGNFEQIKSLLNLGKINEQDIRFFAGYSGWSAGQLQDEYDENAWIVTEADADFVFKTPAKNFWREILKKMGGKHKAIAHYPTDPRLN
jgi:putative transcriptional regulator